MEELAALHMASSYSFDIFISLIKHAELDSTPTAATTTTRTTSGRNNTNER